MKKQRWVHTPRYLLRKHLALRVLRKMPRQRLIDIGCGRGDLLARLVRDGFECVGFETSDEIRSIATKAIETEKANITITGELGKVPRKSFKYAIALEVLEHIEDDLAALRLWRTWIQPDGFFIASVPAKMKYWTNRDEAVGHYRRYERKAFAAVLDQAGFEVVDFWSYGFPLRLLTLPLRKRINHGIRPDTNDQSKEDRSHRSALESTFGDCRGSAIRAHMVNAGAFIFHLLQIPFLRLDLGDGYFVVCRVRS